MKRVLVFLLLCAVAFIPATGFADSKRLVIAINAEPDSADRTSSRFGMVSGPILENMTEKLVGITSDGKLVPGLATWKVAPDGKTIEFTLRKGVKFHSGDPLTSKDVEFSHEREMKTSPYYKTKMRLIEKFEIIDDGRFKIHFTKPDVAFLPMRGPDIASKAYFDKVGEDQFVKRPAGTGPYKFVTWKIGEYMDMEANEAYWGGAPSVKQVRFVFVKEDTTRVSMLKTGEADIVLATPYGMVKDLEAAGYKIAKLPVHGCASVQFHTMNPKVPWADRKVRLAIAHAIDGDSIVKNSFAGIPARYATVAPWEVGYDPKLKPYAYDPEQSKKLLAEAGYAKGFDMPLYYFIGRETAMKETTEAVALYLNAVGIRAKVQGIEAVMIAEKIRAWKKDPNAEYVGVSSVPVAHEPEMTYNTESGFWSESPNSVYSNKEFDTVLQQARVILDEKKRSETFRKALRILHDDVARIPIWAYISVFSGKKNVSFSPVKGAEYPLLFVKDVKIGG